MCVTKESKKKGIRETRHETRKIYCYFSELCTVCQLFKNVSCYGLLFHSKAIVPLALNFTSIIVFCF